MTREDKELLLKDLCARLPYGVMVREDTVLYDDKNTTSHRIKKLSYVQIGKGFSRIKGFIHDYEYIYIPYLFPLSSMTEEQSMELFKLFGISLVDSIGADYIKINDCTGITFFLNKGFDVETHLDKLMDWLHKNHFDYRGLIPMGLALDATDKNIY